MVSGDVKVSSAMKSLIILAKYKSNKQRIGATSLPDRLPSLVVVIVKLNTERSYLEVGSLLLPVCVLVEFNGLFCVTR